jgi:hypothetical protein
MTLVHFQTNVTKDKRDNRHMRNICTNKLFCNQTSSSEVKYSTTLEPDYLCAPRIIFRGKNPRMTVWTVVVNSSPRTHLQILRRLGTLAPLASSRRRGRRPRRHPNVMRRCLLFPWRLGRDHQWMEAKQTSDAHIYYRRILLFQYIVRGQLRNCQLTSSQHSGRNISS